MEGINQPVRYPAWPQTFQNMKNISPLWHILSQLAKSRIHIEVSIWKANIADCVYFADV